MNISLPELLGKSILSLELSSFMKQFGLPAPEKNVDYSGNPYDLTTENDTAGIYLNFDGFIRHKQQYGEPAQRFSSSNDELFLDELTIDNKFHKKRKPAPVELPFGLQLGDSSESVLRKLGKKPNEKMSTSYGHCWWTHFDEFRILTAIGPEMELIWVRLMKLTSDEKEKIRLKKYLGQQNKNINPESSNKVLAYTGNLPTHDWKRRKIDGDELFTDKGIALVEEVLIAYVTNLAALTTQRKAAGIYNSVKKVVTTLNKINDKNNGFIETTEREELCEFINGVVRETGIQMDKNVDLTEEWREW